MQKTHGLSTAPHRSPGYYHSRGADVLAALSCQKCPVAAILPQARMARRYRTAAMTWAI